MFVVLAVLALNPWDLGDEVCPADLARFGYDRASVDELAGIANDRRNWLRANVPWYDPGFRSADHAHAAWTHLKWAWYYAETNSMYESANRLELIHCELRGLYDLIGPEAYRAGVMPDPTPFRRVMP